jgi:hypothetical protein
MIEPNLHKLFQTETKDREIISFARKSQEAGARPVVMEPGWRMARMRSLQALRRRVSTVFPEDGVESHAP